VKMDSRGFHLRLCVLVFSIVVVLCGRTGVGVFVQDLLLSMFYASSSVVSIVVFVIYVRILGLAM